MLLKTNKNERVNRSGDRAFIIIIWIGEWKREVNRFLFSGSRIFAASLWRKPRTKLCSKIDSNGETGEIILKIVCSIIEAAYIPNWNHKSRTLECTTKVFAIYRPGKKWLPLKLCAIGAPMLSQIINLSCHFGDHHQEIFYIFILQSFSYLLSVFVKLFIHPISEFYKILIRRYFYLHTLIFSKTSALLHAASLMITWTLYLENSQR